MSTMAYSTTPLTPSDFVMKAPIECLQLELKEPKKINLLQVINFDEVAIEMYTIKVLPK
jgi:hypothetical protein